MKIQFDRKTQSVEFDISKELESGVDNEVLLKAMEYTEKSFSSGMDTYRERIGMYKEIGVGAIGVGAAIVAWVAEKKR